MSAVREPTGFITTRTRPVRLGRGGALDVVCIVLFGTFPAVVGALWATPIAAGAVATAIGVWRLVGLAGALLEDHLRTNARRRARWAVAREDRL